VALLDEVTRILPDNTWLQELDIHGVEISMQGNTRSSANLIGLFEQSALLENANFKSPLVKVQGGEERFQLAAMMKVINPAEVAGQAGKQPGKKP
jgi:general secretion pathway protein L